MVRELKEHELASPVDISDHPIDRGDTLRWTTVAIAFAAVALLCVNAGTLAAWVDEMAPTPMQQQLSTIANGWADRMAAIGITTPRAKLHEQWKAVQAKRFGEEAPGDTQ